MLLLLLSEPVFTVPARPVSYTHLDVYKRQVYHPLAYYAAYFGIRAKAFDYETMCRGREKMEYYMSELKRKKANHEASKKDEDSLGDMKVVQEMYARGFEFLPIDIYTAKAHEFQIIDGKLMPSLDTIEGLGEKAADGLVEAVQAQDGPFVSKNDLREKSKLDVYKRQWQ